MGPFGVHDYKEKDTTGAIIRHWYIDDFGVTHMLIHRDTSDDNESRSGWDHEPGDPATGADGGWGEADGTPFSPYRSMMLPGLYSDDFRFHS